MLCLPCDLSTSRRKKMNISFMKSAKMSSFFVVVFLFLIFQLLMIYLWMSLTLFSVQESHMQASSRHSDEETQFRVEMTRVVERFHFMLSSVDRKSNTICLPPSESGRSSPPDKGKCLSHQMDKLISKDFYLNGDVVVEESRPDIKTVTLLLLVPEHDKELVSILRSKKTELEKMRVFVATDSSSVASALSFHGTKTFLYLNLNNVSEVLRTLVEAVETRFTLLWTNVKDIILHTVQLEKAISILSSEVNIHGVTFSMIRNKVRTLNCYVMDLQLYELKLKSGELNFISGHPRCHFSRGPLLARTSQLHVLSKGLFGQDFTSENMTMVNCFIELMVKGINLVQCLSCGSLQETKAFDILEDRKTLLQLVKNWNLNLISTEKRKQKYGCEEVNSMCTWENNLNGFAMPLCCSEEQNSQTIKIVDFCEKYSLSYLLTAGTALAAAKLRRCMPWDIDADIFFEEREHRLVQRRIYKDFKGGRYKIGFDKTDKGYSIRLTTQNYKGIATDLYPCHFEPNTALYSDMQAHPIKPTKIMFANRLTTVPFNLGKFSRQRYGYECYQHALHWRSVGGSNLVEVSGGRFKPCRYPEHHACLDVFMPDGNLQF